MDKMHPIGTVSMNKRHPERTVPTDNMHPAGTVPTNKMHLVAILIFVQSIFMSLNLDCISKINERSYNLFLISDFYV